MSGCLPPSVNYLRSCAHTVQAIFQLEAMLVACRVWVIGTHEFHELMDDHPVPPSAVCARLSRHGRCPSAKGASGMFGI